MKFLFAFYCVFLVLVVVFKVPFLVYKEEVSYNFVVFDTLRRYEIAFPNVWSIVNLLGNVMPFYILGVLIKTILNWNILLVMIVLYTSFVIIELLQCFMLVGTFDIDDVIINFFFAVLGFLVTNRERRVVNEKKKN